jgi:hypothetical protein
MAKERKKEIKQKETKKEKKEIRKETRIEANNIKEEERRIKPTKSRK